MLVRGGTTEELNKGSPMYLQLSLSTFKDAGIRKRSEETGRAELLMTFRLQFSLRKWVDVTRFLFPDDFHFNWESQSSFERSGTSLAPVGLSPPGLTGESEQSAMSLPLCPLSLMVFLSKLQS
ncbi:hypothetical protein V6N11_008029 [Hibiscus sabdariffa]|uniref:Uncharacterized protein n=1 Tax=Hibiscus sabdariffa TaxID=183260 RepID=A0ABR2PZL4_9ROSI